MYGSNHPKSSTSLLSYSTLRKFNSKQLFQDLEKAMCVKMYSYNGKLTYCFPISVSLFSFLPLSYCVQFQPYCVYFWPYCEPRRIAFISPLSGTRLLSWDCVFCEVAVQGQETGLTLFPQAAPMRADWQVTPVFRPLQLPQTLLWAHF